MGVYPVYSIVLTTLSLTLTFLFVILRNCHGEAEERGGEEDITYFDLYTNNYIYLLLLLLL